MTAADFRHIRYDVEDSVATITLHRPEALNAFTNVMEAELFEAYDLADVDDDVKAIIITGAGRAFCAGMDLNSSSATFDEWTTSVAGSEAGPVHAVPPAELRRDGGGRVVLRMFESGKPIIAAINGPAVGVGITMTLAADFRLAVPGAKLGFVFARRGLVPESCSSWFLPRLVGLQQALEWVYSGRVFSSEEGESAGLLRSLHAPDELLRAAQELAASFTADSSPVSVALSRQMVWRMLGAPHPLIAHQVETIALHQRGLSGDAAEGISAFLEKRPAAFPDRVSDERPDVFVSFPAPEYQAQVIRR